MDGLTLKDGSHALNRKLSQLIGINKCGYQCFSEEEIKSALFEYVNFGRLWSFCTHTKQKKKAFIEMPSDC
jgi:hypothetical protein